MIKSRSDFSVLAVNLLVLGLMTFSSVSVAAPPNSPTPAPFGTGPSLEARGFFNDGSFTALAEAEEFWDTDNRHVQTFSLGGYYRLLDFLKLGFFYRLAFGLRHDNDWINQNGSSWAWADTSGRGESFMIVDATPRVLLSFLPGESWVGELKTRYFYNFFNQQQTLTLRPGLTYFWLKDDQPFLNFFLQYEMYFPLNYGQATIYEQWLYLGALYHWSKAFKVGPFVAYHAENWGTSASYFAKFNQTYLIQDDSVLYGLTAVFEF